MSMLKEPGSSKTTCRCIGTRLTSSKEPKALASGREDIRRLSTSRPPTVVDLRLGAKPRRTGAPDGRECRGWRSQRKIVLAFDTFFPGIPPDLICRTQRAEPTSVSQSGSSLPGNEDYLPQESGCRN